MKQVFEHFNTEATVFDEHVLKSIPHYQQMIEVIINMLPFTKDKPFTIMDVGTGTGNIAYNIKSAFPKCKLVCLDLAPNMLKIAQEKLKGFKNVEYVEADVNNYTFDRQYDAIVSSLTLHHLETDTDKHAFHKKAYKALKKGGCFINADIIIAPDKKMQQVNLAKWHEFILRSSSQEYVNDRYKKYLAEDRPAILLHEIDSLRKCGFRSVEVFWKYYNFVVYGGAK